MSGTPGEATAGEPKNVSDVIDAQRDELESLRAVLILSGKRREEAERRLSEMEGALRKIDKEVSAALKEKTSVVRIHLREISALAQGALPSVYRERNEKSTRVDK